MHRQHGYLNYLSNSNLDYNNYMNSGRRFGAYAGLAIQQNPSMAGLVINEMGGFLDDAKEQVMDKPYLVGGIALLAYPSLAKSTKKLKTLSKKTEKKVMLAGLASIIAHYAMPMLKGE